MATLIARPVTDEDCRLMWDWVNDPQVRAASFHAGPIPWPTHESWFKARRADPRCRMFIVEERDGGRRVAQVRFEMQPDRRAEVHISVAASARGRGHGTEALRVTCAEILRLPAVDVIFAQIKPDNHRSISAFERAGFRSCATTMVAGHDAVVMTLDRAGSAQGTGLRAVLLPDAGPQAGLGHLHRCLALAAALRDRGVACAFVVGSGAPEARIVSDGFRTVPDADRRGGIRDVLNALTPDLRRGDWPIVVVDAYGVDDGDLAALRATGALVVYIDDLCRHALSAHVVVNGGVTAASLPYQSRSGDTRFLLGPEHALLRSEFAAVPPRQIRPDARHVLLSLGGGDRLNLMPGLIRALDGAVDGAETIVVAGPFFPDVAALEAVARQCRTPVRIVTAPHGTKELMLQADIAVSAGGQTLYELAAVGTPAVAVAVADNQRETVRGMVLRGAAQSVDWTSTDDLVANVPAAVAALAASPVLRTAMSTAGQRLIDGRGAARVAAVITSLAPTPLAVHRQGDRDALLH